MNAVPGSMMTMAAGILALAVGGCGNSGSGGAGTGGSTGSGGAATGGTASTGGVGSGAAAPGGAAATTRGARLRPADLGAPPVAPAGQPPLPEAGPVLAVAA